MNNSPIKILIVDDEPDCIRILGEALDGNYTLMAATKAREALECVYKKQPDLILLDIMMPEIDGYEVLKLLKADPGSRHIPVIFITAADETENEIRGLEMGAADYITKPFNSDILNARIQTHLRLRREMSERKRVQGRLEALFRSIPDTIITVDRHLRMLNTNKNINGCLCYETLRYQLAGDLGKDIALPCCQILLETIKTQSPVKEYRTKCSCLNGQDRVVVLNTALLCDESGIFSGAMIIIRDITRLAELEEINALHSFGGMLGRSKKMQKIYTLAELLADLETTVLVTGESGTGKELFADTLHYSGIRSAGPLIKVNCPALSENLLESELFGHVRGSFTGAAHNKKGRIQAAEGGTLFLDEIGDMSVRVQLALLRFLERKEYERVGDSVTLKADVRVVAATNHNLEEKVRKGLFRKDLWFRLNVVNVVIPSLRERTEDIPLLTRHFISKFGESLKKNIEGMSDEVAEIFLNYQWPGNVRELKNVIERACILCRGGLILPKHLPKIPELPIKVKKSYAPKIKREDLVGILDKSGWSKSKAARALGIARATLYRYMERFDIKEP
jgi:DNA-binding NtrC family response regulator